MPAGDRVTIRPVPSAKRADQRDEPLTRCLCHHLVTPDQSGIGQRQPTQAVIHMRIHARLQQDEVRPDIVLRAGQRAVQDVQIDRVPKGSLEVERSGGIQ